MDQKVFMAKCDGDRKLKLIYNRGQKVLKWREKRARNVLGQETELDAVQLRVKNDSCSSEG